MSTKRAPKVLTPKKLLVAAVGIATVSYVAGCDHGHPTSGNLPAPIPADAAPTPTPGATDAGTAK